MWQRSLIITLLRWMFVILEAFLIKSSSRIQLVMSVLMEKLVEESFTHVKYLVNPN